MDDPWRPRARVWSRRLREQAYGHGAPLDGVDRYALLITNAFYRQYQPLPQNWRAVGSEGDQG